MCSARTRRSFPIASPDRTRTNGKASEPRPAASERRGFRASTSSSHVSRGATHDAGDYRLFIVEAKRFQSHDDRMPLVFCKGRYATLQPTEAPAPLWRSTFTTDRMEVNVLKTGAQHILAAGSQLIG